MIRAPLSFFRSADFPVQSSPGFATRHPGGILDNSPTFQRWELDHQWVQVPKGRLNLFARSAVPSGLLGYRAAVPNVETLGYFRLSLRDRGEHER